MRLRSMLLAAVCLCAAVCSAQTKTEETIVQNQVTVAFSATPVFNANLANFFKMTLTANITSSTLSNADAGQQLQFEICQDATGGRTFVPPANVQGWLTIASAANACTTQAFVFDGSTAVPLTATSAVLNGVVFPASPSTHSVPVVTASNSATYKVVPDCTDTTGNHINYTQSTDAWSCGTSVPANTVTTAGSQTLTNKSLGGTGSTTPNTPYNRLKATQGSALVNGDFSISAGWGSTASITTLVGTDSMFAIIITTGGTGISANPTLTITYHDGTWTNSPLVLPTRGDSVTIAAGTGMWTVQANNPTATTYQFNATPNSGASYVLTTMAVGR
jgi:hypothetical protein